MAQPFEAPIGTSGSQFFVMLARPWGDIEGLYPPLGKVSKGIEALERISALGPVDWYPGRGNLGSLGEIGPLKRPVLIEKVSIERG
jgi:cyclophilin family peptidyl-prolyl cis-trans isomerase